MHKFFAKHIDQSEWIRITMLQKQYGFAYVGFYFMMIDRMFNEPSHKLPFKEYYFDFLMGEMGCDADELRTIVRTKGTKSNTNEHLFEQLFKTCSNLFDLFVIKSGFVYSQSLMDYFSTSEKTSDGRRQAGIQSGIKRRELAAMKKAIVEKDTMQMPPADALPINELPVNKPGRKKQSPPLNKRERENKGKSAEKGKQKPTATAESIFPDHVQFDHLIAGWNRDEFIKLYSSWLTYKKDQHKFTYKSEDSMQKNIELIYQFSEGKFDRAIYILRKAMGNGWHGFFPLKAEDIDFLTKNNSQTTATTAVSTNDKFRDNE